MRGDDYAGTHSDKRMKLGLLRENRSARSRRYRYLLGFMVWTVCLLLVSGAISIGVMRDRQETLAMECARK